MARATKPATSKPRAARSRKAPSRTAAPTPKASAREAALLAAIAESLADDAPRTVYADLVAEQGDDARAELIQLQLARARAGGVMPGRKETSLVTKHGERWLAPIVPVVNKRSWWFERGFVDAVTINARTRAAVAATAGHPLWSTLRKVWLTDAGDPSPILVHPVMRNLRDVHFTGAAGLLGVLRSDAPITGLHGLHVPALERAAQLQPLIDCAALPALALVVVTGAQADAAVPLWSGGLDRPKLRLAVHDHAYRFAVWWERFAAAPPRHAQLIVASASSQARLAAPRAIELSIGAGRSLAGVWDLAIALGLAGAATNPRLSAGVLDRIVVRMPAGERMAGAPLPYASLDELAAAITARARELGTAVTFEVATEAADLLADPREY